MSGLPKGWESRPIGEVTQIIAGGTPPSKDPANFQEKNGVPWLTPADLSGYRNMHISHGARNLSEVGYAASSARKMPAGTVLFSSRAPIGYVAIAKNEISTNQGFKSFVLPDELESRFVYYYLRHIKPLAESVATGTTFKELSGSAAAKLPLLVAPLPEQKRIADKLDAVLARVDACRERLNRVPLILKRFRQSVLAAATSGKLTEDWRQSKDKWNYCKAEKLCEWITKGTTPPKSNMYEGRGDVPYIKVYNLCFDGRLDFTVNPTFVDKDTHEVMLKRSKVFPGDILMNIVGPPLGKVSIVPDSFPEWNINQAIAVFRAKQEINNRFLAYFLMCETTITGLIRKSKATAGQFNLTLEICRQIDVPLPSIEEQHEIVRRVETLFAFADRLEARLATARAATERLTPALLAKAFRGELVPQDPADEPAAALLQRLAASRADAGSKPRRARAAKV